MRPIVLILFVAMVSVMPACAAKPPRDGPHAVSFGGARVLYEFRNAMGDASLRNALVFVHGWGCDHTHWEKQLRGLPTDRVMLAIDLPGYGESGDGGAAHTMDFYAGAVAAAMDDAGIERAVILGHSMGTGVARQVYRNYPERAAGLVAVDGALRPLVDSERMRQFVAPLYTEEWQAFAAGMFDGMAGAMAEPEDRERVKAIMLATPQRSMQGGFEAMLDEAVWEPDPIGVPVLFLLADAPFWTDEYKAWVRSFVADAEFVTFRGASHFLMLDDPEKFNAALLSWLVRKGL